MLQKLLNEHVLDPKNPEKIYNLAREYDRLEQGAMAVSLYLKAADLSNDELLQYKSMLGIALCYDRQGNRRYTVEGALLDAAGLLPDRPEAYYFLSKFYAEGQAWKQSYFYANAGLTVANEDDDIDVGYPGEKSLEVKRAVAKWQITGQQDAKHMLFDLKFKTDLEKEDLQQVSYVLSNIGYPDTIPYSFGDFNRVRFKFFFKGLERITHNYSKHFQDMFVLSVFKGKEKGTYLEIGSGDPFVHNNTALLEKEFNWKGISIDSSPALCCKFKENRNNTVICADATQIGFEDLFEKHCVDNTVDYLQIDCDEASIEVLNKIPFSRYRFGVITLEHDSYRLGNERRDQMRELLKKHGYVLLVNDVAFTEVCSYEDWYVHPDVVEIDPNMRSKKDVNFVWDYFMDDQLKQSEF